MSFLNKIMKKIDERDAEVKRGINAYTRQEFSKDCVVSQSRTNYRRIIVLMLFALAMMVLLMHRLINEHLDAPFSAQHASVISQKASSFPQPTLTKKIPVDSEKAAVATRPLAILPSPVQVIESIRFGENLGLENMVVVLDGQVKYAIQKGNKSVLLSLGNAFSPDSLRVKNPKKESLFGGVFSEQNPEKMALSLAMKRPAIINSQAEFVNGKTVLTIYAKPMSVKKKTILNVASLKEALKKLPPPNFSPQKTRVEKQESLLKKLKANKKKKEESYRHLYAEAISNLKSGDLEEAAAQLKTLVSLKPKHIRAREILAKLLLNNNYLNEAFHVLRAGLSYHPSYTQYAMLQAKVYLAGNRLFDAIKVLEKNTPTVQENTKYYALMGSLYQQAKQYHKAEKTYQEVVFVEPKNSTMWMGLAIAQDQSGKWREALASYKKSLEDSNLDQKSISYVDKRMVILKKIISS